MDSPGLDGSKREVPLHRMAGTRFPSFNIQDGKCPLALMLGPVDGVAVAREAWAASYDRAAIANLRALPRTVRQSRGVDKADATQLHDSRLVR